MRVWNKITEQLKTGNSCVLISILDAKGSTPREVGTRMLLLGDGTTSGTIGGGQVEWEVLKHARTRLTKETPHSLLYCKVSLGPSVGQCCGGSMMVGIEAITPDFLNEAQRFDRLEQSGSFQCRVTVKGDGTVERNVLPKIISEHANQNVSHKNLKQNQFIEFYGEIRHPLYIFGAGHVGHAFMLTLGTLPFDVSWIDGRPNQFPPAVPANYRCILEENYVNALVNAPDGSFVLIMTHNHGIDMEIARIALLQERFGYVGLIGSKTKRTRFKKRLLESGVLEAQFEKLVCPIGIEGIRSKIPAAIAASTTAQLLIRLEEIGNADTKSVTKKKGAANEK